MNQTGPAADEPRAVGKPVIGLAGGIGAGKSRVAGLLESLGAHVIRSDEVNQQELEHAEVRRTLSAWWGPAVLDSRGRVDRGRVADIVFNDPEQRRRLESLLHPRIEANRRRQMEAAARDPRVRAVVIDAPLLYEAGLDAVCDCVIFVEAPAELRAARVAAGRGWSKAELERREKSQRPLDIKRSKADYICVNDSDERTLSEQVKTIFQQIVASHSPVGARSDRDAPGAASGRS
jgi:dephospho-CoA kinase